MTDTEGTTVVEASVGDDLILAVKINNIEGFQGGMLILLPSLHLSNLLLLWIFYVFSVLCLLCFCTHLFICAFWCTAGKGLTSWLL